MLRVLRKSKTTWALRLGFGLCLFTTSLVLCLTTASLNQAFWVLLCGILPLIVVFFLVERKIELVISREQRTSLLLRSLIQNAPTGIALFDSQFLVLHANEAVAPLLHSEASAIRPTLEAVLSGGDPATIELELNGNHFLIYCFPAPGAQEKGHGVGVIATDITESKRAQEKLTQSNSELEKFAYMASHDLKEPIRMISTYLGVFTQRYSNGIDEKGKQYLTYACDGAKRLSGLVDSLLRYSRLGEEKMEVSQVELSTVVSETLANLKQLVLETKAEIRWDRLPVVAGDRVQLSLLFQNLLSNAIKFRQQETPPKISILAEKQHSATIVAIKDNGIGIETRERDRIFEIFRRAHSRAEFPGDGIGLASCKRIVEGHGGKIWVESQVGQGSTFYFSIPNSLGANLPRAGRNSSLESRI